MDFGLFNFYLFKQVLLELAVDALLWNKVLLTTLLPGLLTRVALAPTLFGAAAARTLGLAIALLDPPTSLLFYLRLHVLKNIVKHHCFRYVYVNVPFRKLGLVVYFSQPYPMVVVHNESQLHELKAFIFEPGELGC